MPFAWVTTRAAMGAGRGDLLALVVGQGMRMLAAGGVAYTAGVAFYAAPRLRYAHFLWHLAVLAGTACHLVAVLNYSV